MQREVLAGARAGDLLEAPPLSVYTGWEGEEMEFPDLVRARVVTALSRAQSGMCGGRCLGLITRYLGPVDPGF